ncbi:hypothetical protein LAZ67_3003102 [Cordylochernes scorpioides]|uniref:Transposase n=1 Tax=Cordylochernes scorpioides TaxID=51811 RepID=A0ABY6KBM3_9ARAC|nr:hypothetical protein LAZ67_3003102 [Cordylochernes scorpioides]
MTYRSLCFLPYSPSSVDIARKLRSYGIRTIYKNPPNLLSSLRHPHTKSSAPPDPLRSMGAVYSVSCEQCPATYVEAFGDAALSRSRTFEWFSRFLKGREKVNDDQHTGRPRSLRCEENKLKIKELIKSNRRISIKDLSSETGLSVGLCHQILTKDFDMIRTSSKFVPRILTEEQKEYDPETKRQSSQWIENGEPKPKKARFTKFKVKILLVTFFYINGLVHHEFIPFGRTINQEVYLGIMRRLREAVRLKRPGRWKNKDWILHVDNARPHTAHVVLQFLSKHSTIQIPHPPYSPT